MPTGFAVAGVHMTLAAVLQSCSTVHPVALSTHHLNCTGAAPPVAAADSVVVHPCGSGAARSADTVTAVTSRSLCVANGRATYFTGAFDTVSALRAPAPTMPPGFAVAGVHAALVAGLQSCSTVHPAALNTHHLNCTGAAPPV